MNTGAQQAADLLEQQAGELASMAAAKLLRDHPQINERFGNDASRIWSEHFEQRILELCAALAADEANLFVSRVTWSRKAMQARKAEAGDLAESLKALRDIVEENLTGDAQRTALEYLDTALDSMIGKAVESDTSLLDPGIMPERVALRYIQAVIAGNAIPGMAIVQDAVEDGLSERDAILRVLIPAQREVGRLWHMNKISVAEEHMVTMTTQRLMAVLASSARHKTDRGRTAVAAAVAGNIHDIGIRAIAYLMEFDGWRTIYLGPDVPKSDMPAAIECFDADIVLLSLALSSQLPALQRTITEIRSRLGGRVKIMVGGNGLGGAPDLWKTLGADGFAESAEMALIVADELIPIT